MDECERHVVHTVGRIQWEKKNKTKTDREKEQTENDTKK